MYLNHVDGIRHLVIDEADRLTQTGRYTEVQQLVSDGLFSAPFPAEAHVYCP